MSGRTSSKTVLGAAAAVVLSGCATYGDFNLRTLNGRNVALSDQKGKTVLLAFWAAG